MNGLLMLVPAFAVATMLVVEWLVERDGAALRVVAPMWLVGVCLQFFLPRASDLVSLAGLLINVVLGIYLAIRFRLT